MTWQGVLILAVPCLVALGFFGLTFWPRRRQRRADACRGYWRGAAGEYHGSRAEPGDSWVGKPQGYEVVPSPELPTVYIGAGGDDERGDGSRAKPFVTIDRALQGHAETGVAVCDAASGILLCGKLSKQDWERVEAEQKSKEAHLRTWMGRAMRSTRTRFKWWGK